jgi:prevent-host-death family protein
MEIKPVTRSIDALSARTRFGELMEQAESKNLRFLVSRRGKPKVVILGVEDYLRNIVKKDELLAEIQVSSKRAGLDKMTEGEIDREIQATRRAKKTK